MVLIDKERCTGCGSCVKICHEHCMSLIDKKVSIDRQACSTCSQCIAICPEKALSWDRILPIDFDPNQLPSVLQMEELFAERRTIRTFFHEPVDRKALEEIVSWGAYAPTHNFNLRCIAIDDPKIIEVFDKAAFRFSKRIYQFVFRPKLIRWLVSIAPRSMQEEFDKAVPKLETAITRGRGYDSRPPALVCVVGDRRVPLSLESAQYALYNMSLFAQVKGLGCRNLVGNQMIFNRSKEIRKLLGLKASERILAIAGFGHPAVRFRNKVLGKRMSIQWNSSPDRKGESDKANERKAVLGDHMRDRPRELLVEHVKGRS
jgi:NAD-dependent dihydropyrimidine dehydrogenase PreA subunit/nitroreductase